MKRQGSQFLYLIAVTHLMAIAPATLSAEKLPIRAYSTIDGLPHNTVMRIVRDSHGFLWFCTMGGLARFDGYTFQRYDAEQGLRGTVTDLLETHSGEYWVATLNGLYRFHPSPPRPDRRTSNGVSHDSAAQPMFELYHLSAGGNPEGVNTLHEDRQGAVWAGTNGGLYRLMRSDGRWNPRLVDLAVPGKAANAVRVLELMEDYDGALWISLPNAGLRQLLPDGLIINYTTLGLPAGLAAAGSFEGIVNTMLEDHDRRVWLGTDRGLTLLVRRSGSAQLDRVRTYTMKDGLRDDNVAALVESADGSLSVGTSTGLSQFCVTSNCGKSLRSYVTPPLGRFGAWTLVNDRDGNLWLGNETGALRLARDGFTTYDEADGLGSSRVYSISENTDGTLYVVTPGPHGGEVNEFKGNHFRRISPALQGSRIDPAAPLRASALQDHGGDWWITTDQGLYQYSGVRRVDELARTRPSAVYTSRNGLPPASIISLYGDSRGDLWVGSNIASAAAGALSQWQRSTRSFHVYGAADGLPASMPPFAFCQDRSGSVWVGFRGDSLGRLARFREGHFTVFTGLDGLPDGSIWSLYRDHAGRLWVATTEGGVARVDHPEAEHPRFDAYTTAQGLASNQVQAITEDQWGRVYLLTNRGVDRLDPETGWVKHYTSADGLVSSSHWGAAFRDRQGALWFGTLEGLSQLMPRPDEPASPPPIRITGIRVRGNSYPVSELGQMAFTPFVLEPSLNQVQIDFAGLNFGVGENLRYQYKLEGADQDWSRPTEQRTINYATLSPGKYRFLVRALNWKGMVSPEPAVVPFRVLAPVWQRWWFVMLAAFAAGGVVYALHYNRVIRLLELERIRSRIATDLHDDVGASLSHIAVLSEVATSEVARLGLAPEGQRVYEPLSRIGSLSRELIDSMSDIVWAISPHKDRVGSLTQRMREFAGEVFGSRGIDFHLSAAGVEQDMKLDPEVRRQVFLIFKESVNNIVRHSVATCVICDLGIEGRHLVLRVTDNGRGFTDPANRRAGTGLGLLSMRRRAEALGGSLDIDAEPNRGVTVVLRVRAA